MRQPTQVAAKRRAAMERAHAVDEQRTSRHDHFLFVFVERRAGVSAVVRRPQNPLRIVAPRTNRRWRVVGGDIRVVQQVGRLPIGGIIRRIGQRMIAVVAVHALILIRGMALALEAQMRLFAVHLAAAGHAASEFDEIGMQRDGVQMGTRKRKTIGQCVRRSLPERPSFRLLPARIVTELHPPRQQLPPFFQSACQFLGAQKALDDGVAVFSIVGCVFRRDAFHGVVSRSQEVCPVRKRARGKQRRRDTE